MTSVIGMLIAVQDEEHVIFDCENEALISLRVQYQGLFKDAEENSASRLRDFVQMMSLVWLLLYFNV